MLPVPHLLSALYEHCKNKGMTAECEAIIKLSPVAWQHISLVGKYEFATNAALPALDVVVKEWTRHLGKVAIVVQRKKQRYKLI